MVEPCTTTTPHEGHPVPREPLPPGWCPGVDYLDLVVAPPAPAEPPGDAPAPSGRGDGTTTGPQAATALSDGPAVARVLDAVRRALYKARREYVRVAEQDGQDPGPERECWAEFEALADAVAALDDPALREAGATPEHWRVGTKVGRTIYAGTADNPRGRLIGLMDTPALAAQVVAAVNGQADLQREGDAPSETASGLERADGPGWHPERIEHLALWLESGCPEPPMPPEMAAELRALLADRDRLAGVVGMVRRLAFNQQTWIDHGRVEQAISREAVRDTLLDMLGESLTDVRARIAADLVDAREEVEQLRADRTWLRERLDGCVWVAPGRRSGEPCLGGTRLSASIVAGLAADGLSGEQIRESYPGASDAGVKAAVAFTGWLAGRQADALNWAAGRPGGPVLSSELRRWAAEVRAGRLSIPTTDTEEE
jgi:uncharacterized protein (DUF433 family)